MDKEQELIKKTNKEHPSIEVTFWTVQHQGCQDRQCFQKDGVVNCAETFSHMKNLKPIRFCNTDIVGNPCKSKVYE